METPLSEQTSVISDQERADLTSLIQPATSPLSNWEIEDGLSDLMEIESIFESESSDPTPVFESESSDSTPFSFVL